MCFVLFTKNLPRVTTSYLCKRLYTRSERQFVLFVHVCVCVVLLESSNRPIRSLRFLLCLSVCVCVDEFVGRFFSFVLIRVNSLFVFINYVSAACIFFTALVDTCLLPPCLSFNVTSIHSMI